MATAFSIWFGVVGFCSIFFFCFSVFRFCHILDEKFVAVMFTALVSKINYGQATDWLTD